MNAPPAPTIPARNPTPAPSPNASGRLKTGALPDLGRSPVPEGQHERRGDQGHRREGGLEDGPGDDRREQGAEERADGHARPDDQEEGAIDVTVVEVGEPRRQGPAGDLDDRDPGHGRDRDGREAEDRRQVEQQGDQQDRSAHPDEPGHEGGEEADRDEQPGPRLVDRQQAGEQEPRSGDRQPRVRDERARPTHRSGAGCDRGRRCSSDRAGRGGRHGSRRGRHPAWAQRAEQPLRATQAARPRAGPGQCQAIRGRPCARSSCRRRCRPRGRRDRPAARPPSGARRGPPRSDPDAAGRSGSGGPRRRATRSGSSPGRPRRTAAPPRADASSSARARPVGGPRGRSTSDRSRPRDRGASDPCGGSRRRHRAGSPRSPTPD